MAVLTSEVKTFITQALACFDSPTQVVEAVKKDGDGVSPFPFLGN